MIPGFYTPSPPYSAGGEIVHLGMKVASPSLVDERMSILTAIQVSRIIGEIERINARLAELGDSDEDRIEELLLRAARRLLLRDLHELAGYEYYRKLESDETLAPAGAGAVVEAQS